jgi:hypothetical protein
MYQYQSRSFNTGLISPIFGAFWLKLQMFLLILLVHRMSTHSTNYTVTCHLRSQPIQRFIARQQLRKHATILETLLGSSQRVTMEEQLEAVFSVWSAPRLYHAIDSSKQFSLS